jgi:hypothetical protein
MGRKSTSGSGIRDEQPRSYFLELRNHLFGLKKIKFFYVDPGWKEFGSGILDGKNSEWKKRIWDNIPNPQQ